MAASNRYIIVMNSLLEILAMPKLTRIDAIMIAIAMIFILPQLQMEPESASAFYNGIYEFTDTVVKGFFGLILVQLFSRKRLK